MRKIVILPLVLVLMLLAFAPPLRSQNEYFSLEQLDNLLAPIALYPDPLLAQVLLAVAFPDQIDEAARFMRAGAGAEYIDSQPWDVSVKAVAHYPTVLDMMADTLNWTTDLGRAYASQPADVLASVQRLRQEARAAGNLETNPEQEVVVTDGYIEIWPVDPQYIFVPEYDPNIVYVEPDGFDDGPAVSYGSGFLIGAWLNDDCDWPHHRIYHHGWKNASGWIERSRPYVNMTSVHMKDNLLRVLTSPAVANRKVVPSTPKVRANDDQAIRRDINTHDARTEPPRRNVPEVKRPEAARPAIQSTPRQIERPERPDTRAPAVSSQATHAIRAEISPSQPAARTESRPPESRDTDKKR
jgi:hypothetical protein